MLLFFVVVIGHRDDIVSHVKNSFFVAFPKVKLWLPTFDFDFSKELFHLCLYVCIDVLVIFEINLYDRSCRV